MRAKMITNTTLCYTYRASNISGYYLGLLGIYTTKNMLFYE